MQRRKSPSENDFDTAEEERTSGESDASHSDNDRRNYMTNVQMANVNRRNTQQIRKISGHRAIVLRVPLYEQRFHCKPAPIRKRKTRPISTEKKVDTNHVIPIIKNILTPLGILMISLIPYLIYTNKVQHSQSGACDMNLVENRDFNKYYGILPNKNHFITQTTVECNSDIIFKSVLPTTVLESDNSASSFIVLGKYGTGKTLLRCHYFKSLQSNSYFKVLILNKQINDYLQRFVSKTSTNEKYSEIEHYLIGWSQNEFAQLILSVLVTQFVDTFEKEQFDLPNISLDAKMNLITIICYYYNEQDVSKLENFVNTFLKKTDNLMYRAGNAKGQILERNTYQDKPLLLHFKKDLNKLSILRKNEKKLELLLGIVEGEEFQHIAIEKTMSDEVFESLTHFTLFMKNDMKRPVVFIIDGIDENQYFFQENVANKMSLELFYRSSISQEILAAVMAQNFYLSLFYPEIDGIIIQDAVIRNDKFPVYTIKWDTRSLINYGDYLLQKMNKNVSAIECKSLPDFRTLVNYTNTATANIIDRISTPRAFHYFMQKLIVEMENCANDVEKPFIAIYENVDDAFKKSIQ